MAADPYRYFRIEARELVEQIGKGLLELEKRPGGTDVVAHLLRLTHTLKGAARVVRQPEIADLAHAIEDTLAPARQGAAGVERARIDEVLRVVDAIASRVQGLAPATDGGPAATAAAMSAPAQAPDASFRALPVSLEDPGAVDALLDGVAEATVQLAAVRRVSARLEGARSLADRFSEAVASPRAGGLTNGTLARTRAIADELRGLLLTVERDLTAGIEQVAREQRQVRDAAERLRLLPAALAFHSLDRAVRDAAHSLGKRVEFEATGGEVRLDAHVLGAMLSALVQLARNAVAHGIESEAERRAAAKPPVGRVTLSVERRGNRVAFACSDDGRGIDLEAVRRIAEARGLRLAEGAAPRPAELWGLLLQGGISTSRQVTDVSGRGVGLDVVREVTHRLGGVVTVDTDAHRGTTIEVVVPVSISALEALVVEAGGQTVAIPLAAVRRTLRLAAGDLVRTSDAETVLYDGVMVPFAALSRSLRSTAAASTSRKAWSGVVVGGGGGLAVVGVDRLLGSDTVVMRPLPRLAPADPIVMGASLDAEGRPQLVLDPDGLVAAVRRTRVAAEVTAGARLPILVVDDSLTTRMLERSILESAGYEVDLAVSGEEALDKVRLQRYALLLVDVEMPGMDGFTLLERVGADPALRGTPAILVTSRNAPEDRRRGAEVGARAYVVKSEFDQSDLLDRIRKLVG